MHRNLTIIFIIIVLGGLIASVTLSYEIATSAKSPLPCVLLIDDDQDNPDVQAYYASALDELRATHNVWDVAAQGDPSANDLVGYKMVIWFTGYPRNNTFTSANEATVAAYLDAGGCFWLVSEDYLYDRGLTPFGQNRLRIRSYSNDVNRTDLEGTGEPPAPVLVSYNLIPPPGWPGELYTDNVFNSPG